MKSKRINSFAYYGLIVGFAVVYTIPLIWVLSSSFRTELNMFDPSQWIPRPATLKNYDRLFDFLPEFNRYVWNTVVIASLSTAGQLVSCSLAGYALARYRFRGRSVILFVLIGTLMVPGQVTLIPTFVLFRHLGLLNTRWALIIPACFGSAYFTFFFRQFFMNIPRELEEAAYLDGAGRLRTFISVIVPVAKPTFISLGTLTFVSTWNGFFLPSVYLMSRKEWVLSQALRALTSQSHSEWGAIMAGVVLASLPMVLLYLVAQRYLIEGIMFSGLKG